MLKPKLLGLGLGCSLVLGVTAESLAVEPAPIAPNAKVEWSKVVRNPFDGAIVYDKHFTSQFAFVTSWAETGIRATYTQYHRELVGYRTVWREKQVRDYGSCSGKRCHKTRYRYVSYPEQEPIYRHYSTEKVPDALLFAVDEQVYRYESGSIPADLVKALANAPSGELTIRAVWDDGSTSDMPIGKHTVSAWKSLFNRPGSRAGSAQSLPADQ